MHNKNTSISKINNVEVQGFSKKEQAKIRTLCRKYSVTVHEAVRMFIASGC